MFNPIPDHIAQALRRLITQYAESPNIKALISAIVAPIQDIETMFTELNTLRYLPDAQGAQLDVIGIIVGEPRPPGMSDANYLNLIYGRIKINTSQGQPEYAIQTFQLFTGATQVILTEGVASVIIESAWVPPSQDIVDFLIRTLLEVLPAGVRPDGIVAYDPDMAFAYAGALPGFGYDDGSQTVGGKYPTLYQFHGHGFEYAGNDVLGLGYGSIHDPLVGGIYLT